MSGRQSRDWVDASLEAARREAGVVKLPQALRSRILAATLPKSAPPPRARLLEFALRAAAVAAVFAAALVVLPESLNAADLDPRPLLELNGRIAASVADRLPQLGFDELSPSLLTSHLSADSSLPLGAAAVVLVGAGLLLVRTERRR